MNGPTTLQTALAVFRKEIVDALRDRRTLLVVLASSVLVGPLVLIALSFFLAGFEARAEKREVVVMHMERAPSLKNYFERQNEYVMRKLMDDVFSYIDNKNIKVIFR